MNEKCVLFILAATIGSVCSELKSSSVISSNNLVLPHELTDFLFDFDHATSKNLLASITGDNTQNAPVESDWQTAVNIMYKYKELTLFALIDVYPLLPDNENKILIHNAVMNLLENHKDDDRILMLLDVRQQKQLDLRSHVKTLLKCNPYLGIINWKNDADTIESSCIIQSTSERGESD